MGGWSHSRLAPAINSERFEIFKTEGLTSGGGIAMGLGGHNPLGQHPGTISRKSSEAVFEAAAAAPGFSRCRVGVMTGVGVAEVARTRVGDICLLYTSPSPRDMRRSRMPSSGCGLSLYLALPPNTQRLFSPFTFGKPMPKATMLAARCTTSEMGLGKAGVG